jgi:hypothetical protein
MILIGFAGLALTGDRRAKSGDTTVALGPALRASRPLQTATEAPTDGSLCELKSLVISICNGATEGTPPSAPLQTIIKRLLSACRYKGRYKWLVYE